MAAAAERRPDPRRVYGDRGEDQAAAWYVEHGWTVLDRNWRGGREGEIDLVVKRGRVVAFCEVKARRSAAFGVPAEAVTPTKQARIRRLAARWLREHDVRGAEVRFDVAAILAGNIDIIESAF